MSLNIINLLPKSQSIQTVTNKSKLQISIDQDTGNQYLFHHDKVSNNQFKQEILHITSCKKKSLFKNIIKQNPKKQYRSILKEKKQYTDTNIINNDLSNDINRNSLLEPLQLDLIDLPSIDDLAFISSRSNQQVTIVNNDKYIQYNDNLLSPKELTLLDKKILQYKYKFISIDEISQSKLTKGEKLKLLHEQLEEYNIKANNRFQEKMQKDREIALRNALLNSQKRRISTQLISDGRASSVGRNSNRGGSDYYSETKSTYECQSSDTKKLQILPQVDETKYRRKQEENSKLKHIKSILATEDKNITKVSLSNILLYCIHQLDIILGFESYFHTYKRTTS